MPEYKLNINGKEEKVVVEAGTPVIVGAERRTWAYRHQVCMWKRIVWIMHSIN